MLKSGKILFLCLLLCAGTVNMCKAVPNNKGHKNWVKDGKHHQDVTTGGVGGFGGNNNKNLCNKHTKGAVLYLEVTIMKNEVPVYTCIQATSEHSQPSGKIKFDVGDSLNATCRSYNKSNNITWEHVQEDNNDFALFETQVDIEKDIKEQVIMMTLTEIDDETGLICKNGENVRIRIELELNNREDNINKIKKTITGETEHFSCTDTFDNRHRYLVRNYDGRLESHVQNTDYESRSKGYWFICFQLSDKTVYNIQYNAETYTKIYTRNDFTSKYYGDVEGTTVVPVVNSTEVPINASETPQNENSTSTSNGLEWKIPVGVMSIIVILILTVVIVLQLNRRKKRSLNRVKTQDVIYARPMTTADGRNRKNPKPTSSNQVVYAELEMAESSGINIRTNEETPYAEIIGVMVKDTKL